MYWGMYAKRLRRAWENVFKTYSTKFPKLRKILIKDLKISILPVFFKKPLSNIYQTVLFISYFKSMFTRLEMEIHCE